MPCSRGVNVFLESQYDIRRIPEYKSAAVTTTSAPRSPNTGDKDNETCGPLTVVPSGTVSHPCSAPSSPPSLRSSVDTSDRHVGVDGDGEDEGESSVNRGRELDGGASAGTRSVDVYVPIYPNSQFWLSYSADPDTLDWDYKDVGASGGKDAKVGNDGVKVRYLYFKLLLHTRSDKATTAATATATATAISWGIGAKEDWKGKTMFGLFRAPPQSSDCRDGSHGKYGAERRALCFSGEQDVEGMFEIRIFRAVQRRRISRMFDEYGGEMQGAVE